MKGWRHFFYISACGMLVLSAIAQGNSGKQIWDKLIEVENDSVLPIKQKLKEVEDLKTRFEDLKIAPDSVYARILHRLGLYEYLVNNEIPNNKSLAYTQEAATINTSNKKNTSPRFAVNSYRNLASYYKTLKAYTKAISYYDSAIATGRKLPGDNENILLSIANKNDILFLTGDHQKCIEESTLGLAEAKASNQNELLLIFYNQRAQSNFYQSNIAAAIVDADSAISLASRQNNTYELATALKTKALTAAYNKQYQSASALFTRAISERKKTANDAQVADDYIDLGAFYFNQNKELVAAARSYHEAAANAHLAGDKERLAKAFANLGEISSYSRNYNEAASFYAKALFSLGMDSSRNIISIPSLKQLTLVPNTDLLLEILSRKTQLLLALYKIKQENIYLTSALKNAKLTDSLITNIRHQHTEEESKLYWRNRTQSFYEDAVEACYLAKNDSLAFYFIEKSRSVLLNDKLNELGAASHLPSTELTQEKKLQMNIVQEEKKLALLTENTKEYLDQQLHLLNAKDEFERYIKALETRYPAYYQYKYDDHVPTLSSLQNYLSKGNQSFVHYFLTDSACYILAIGKTSTRFMRLESSTFNKKDVVDFLRFCSGKNRLVNQYNEFASAAYRLYQQLFAPLQIAPGRVIVCAGNFLIPFDALCSDKDGRHFLLQDYTLSYVYSARYLTGGQVINVPGKGDFFGIAPVSFAGYMQLPALKQSENALKISSSNYRSSKLLVSAQATHRNFIANAKDYSVINVFSHARADSINEPLLYMGDSILHLYELQLLTRPASQLIVLSACQTNVGVNATGEGIYSLARGFAATGIPSVAATLWSADESAIYAISEKFHEYLARKMPKDEALRQAKLYYMETYGGEKTLPYYWANIILLGDSKPLQLGAAAKTNSYWPAEIAIALLSFAGIVFFLRNNAKRKYRQTPKDPDLFSEKTNLHR